MILDALKNYRSLVVDYSIVREFGGTEVFSDFLDIIMENRQDVYVSKTFKLYHYCVLHQADERNASASNAMRDFCAMLLPNKQLHSVQVSETCEFMSKISLIPDCLVVMANSGIFIRRLREKKPDFNGDLCVLSKDGEAVVYHGMKEFLEGQGEEEISPLASLDKYLDVPVYCNVGDTVLTGENKPVTLDKRVSAGAEGMVFTTDNPRIVAKIYHKGIITPLRWRKLTLQVSMGLNSTGVCWPKDLLFYKGIPVGYTMIMGKGRTLGNVFDGPDALLNSFPDWKRLDIVTTLADLLEKYLYLHMNGITAGDIQMKNALIYSATSIYLIDMDSVQVGNLPCPVGTEEFTDPRLWGKSFSSFLRKLTDEDYSIAMLVFSLLFCGLHPYATRNGAETLREEILGKNFPYDLDDKDEEHIPKGGYNYIWQYLPENLRVMLYKTFREGKVYETVEWYDAVLSYKEALSSGQFSDEESYKVFPKMDYKPTDPHPVSSPKFSPRTSAGSKPAAGTTQQKESPFASRIIKPGAVTNAVSNKIENAVERRAAARSSSANAGLYGGNVVTGKGFTPPASTSDDSGSSDGGGIFKIFKKGN